MTSDAQPTGAPDLAPAGHAWMVARPMPMPTSQGDVETLCTMPQFGRWLHRSDAVQVAARVPASWRAEVLLIPTDPVREDATTEER